MTTLTSLTFFIDPTKETPGTVGVYKYDPIDKLSRNALNAYSEQANSSTQQGAEDTLILGGGQPSDASKLYNEIPLLSTAPLALAYMDSVVYLPTTLTTPINSLDRGVNIAGTKCVVAVVNHDRTGNNDDHFLCTQNNSNNSMLGNGGISGAVALGDDIEIFAFDEALVPAFSNPANPTYAELNAITRYSISGGAGLNWIFSGAFPVDNEDEIAPGFAVLQNKGLKPKAASGTTFDVTVIIDNAPITLDPGLEVAVNNKTQNGTKLATDGSLVWFSVDETVGPSTEGTAVATITNLTGPTTGNPIGAAVVECDELEFFVRIPSPIKKRDAYEHAYGRSASVRYTRNSTDQPLRFLFRNKIVLSHASAVFATSCPGLEGFANACPTPS